MRQSVLLFLLGSFFLGVFLVPFLRRGTATYVSSHPKADPWRRFVAAAVDVAVVVSVFGALSHNSVLVAALLSPLYLLLRDALVPGQSIGKIWMGLAVIHLESGALAGYKHSIRRNALLVVPGLNVVALGLELGLTLTDRQGIRLGDRLAKTQVIESRRSTHILKVFSDAKEALRDRARAGAARPARTACP